MISAIDLSWLLKLWDSGHFIGIAENGYKYDFQLAFYPLFPLVVSFFSTIFSIKAEFIAVILNVTFLIVSFIFLKKLILLDFSRKVWLKSSVAFLFFPTSFFLLLPYSESLFLMLTIISFYYSRKKDLLLSLFFASLTLITRPLGIAVVIAIFYELFFIQKKYSYFYFLVFFPFAFYWFYSFSLTGNIFHLLEVEHYWQRSITFPGQNIAHTLSSFLKNSEASLLKVALAELVALILGIGLTLRSFRYLRPTYSIYMLFSILIPLFTSTLTSLPRFLLVLFPIFILIGLIKNNTLYLVAQLLSLICLTFFIFQFMKGNFVS